MSAAGYRWQGARAGRKSEKRPAKMETSNGIERSTMDKGCIFCQIVGGEKPADFVHQGESLVVFRDIRPSAPIHLLIVPRRHIRSINDLQEEDRGIVSEMILTARDVARRLNISQSGYRLVFNVERGGGQWVFHLHMHLMGGW